MDVCGGATAGKWREWYVEVKNVNVEMWYGLAMYIDFVTSCVFNLMRASTEITPLCSCAASVVYV